jgi:hypothetical protein
MFETTIRAATWDTVNSAFQKLEPETSHRVAASLTLWLVRDARKKPSPDIVAKINAMSEQIRFMADRLVVTTDGKAVTVTALDGKAKDTLVLLNRGSNWFDGHPDVVKAIASAVFNEQ